MLKRLRFNPPFLGVYSTLSPKLYPGGGLLYFCEDPIDEVNSRLKKLLQKDGILDAKTIEALLSKPNSKPGIHAGTIEHWLELHPLLFKHGENGPIFQLEEIKHEAIFSTVFDCAIRARKRVFNPIPEDEDNFLSFPFSKLKDMSKNICDALDVYKHDVNLGREEKLHGGGGVYGAYYSLDNFAIVPTLLDNGEALLEYIQTSKGRKFIKDFGDEFEVEYPLMCVLSLQILMDMEIFVLLMQKREKELDPAPDIIKDIGPDWRERIMSRLLASILKTSGITEEGEGLLFKSTNYERNASRKFEKVRTAILNYYDLSLSEEERRAKRHTAVDIITKALLPIPAIFEEAKRLKMETKAGFETYVFTVLSKERKCRDLKLLC